MPDKRLRVDLFFEELQVDWKGLQVLSMGIDLLVLMTEVAIVNAGHLSQKRPATCPSAT
jgi:hypothetical protein